jgi:serine/threonine-protein kinase
MGRVLEAWDTLLRRRVAIKLLHSTDPVQTLRFFREAQSQARLEHPNICRILELGNDTERPYLVMPLIQGPTLADLDQDLDPRDIARILADVAGAIQEAHRSGLVHRDLKPHNILLETWPDGGRHPVVVDFGLARDLSLQDRTLTWAMVGTPAFMSPEQARGETPTPAADIYSLGATLYALLSGGPPYEAATVAGLAAEQLRREARPLRSLRPGVPRDLETITMKCLETEPARRYPSAQALEEDLRRYVEGHPIGARPVSWAGRLIRRSRRNRNLVATLVVSALLVAGLLGWNVRTRVQGSRQVEIAQRFGMEIREIETMLRVERMLPVHDMRPVEGRVKEKLAAFQASMSALGAVAQGPGHYALGRGYLALRDYAAAQTHLETAWNKGFHLPDVASALGQVHSAELERDRVATGSLSREEQSKVLAELKKRHQEPALAFFALTAGSDSESQPLALARRALLEGRNEDCAAFCREAFAQQPWRYEALVLEASAYLHKANQLADSGAPAPQVRAVLNNDVLASLDKAHQLAPSDAEIHRLRIQILTSLAVQDSEAGRPTLVPFQMSEVIFEEACRIQPADGELWNARFFNLIRETFVRLAKGEDTRGRCRDIQALHRTALAQFGQQPPPILEETAFTCRWLLAESDWRRGEDPRPIILSSPPTHREARSLDRAEALNVLARHESQHGRDPLPLLQESLAIGLAFAKNDSTYYYPETVLGETLLVQATWEWWTGRDPLESITKGVEHLHRALAIKDGSVYPYFHLSQLRALEAQVLLAQGRDPWTPLAEALAAGRRAVAIRPDHFRSQLGLGEALLTQALVKSGRGETPSFEEAEAAFRQARALNPTDWRIALALGRLALAQAAWADKAGLPAQPHLDRAGREAAAGLAVKADAPELLWLRAEAALMRYASTRDPKAQQAADDAARQALALCPTLAPARKVRDQLGNSDATRRATSARTASRASRGALDPM